VADFKARLKTADPTDKFDNLHKMFVAAEANLSAATVIERASNPHLAWPGIILRALALEVLFKCLILIEGNTYTKSHDLVDLFNLLSDKSKNRITELAKPHIPNLQKFISMLHDQSRKRNHLTAEQSRHRR
jgi:hypothetical protein